MDSRGRVWMTSKIRPNQDPAWCSDPANKFAAWFPLQHQRTPGVRLRSEDEAVHADRHLLLDAPSAVRQRRERDPLLQRADGSDRRLDRHEGLRPDQGRAEGRRLVRPGRRHQRRRQDHAAVEFSRRPRPRLRSAQAAAGRVRCPIRRSTRMVDFNLYSRGAEPGRQLGLGRVRAISRDISSASTAARIRPRAAAPRSSACPSRASIRAASTSTATASSGRRSPPAAISPASIAASARALSGRQGRRQRVPRGMDALSDERARS